MTLDELITVLTGYQRLGYGARAVTAYADARLDPTLMFDPTNTVEITGVFAGDDDEEVVLETVAWRHGPVEIPQSDRNR